ncbi:Extracellular membrane protein, CFEM domain protein [Cordyceps fumosorosea ARSEF 2679]|uniref:Extracellular membrane protein, CFEM domain protein n=1 Tax=Cordyceps fumosorosea (strain ARSEF 2679) TaxID=1081104 RepID=A0A168BX08_CORFA|nr:Extracellular membrane protein, CFEM domain protein [Cordyceps fumosorosea ARSEF 2679]OAA70655.1 Extracellular membrane protein, CFEM domain protein [Cordyceps fumosorosea ARSEF 2679]
MLVRHWGLAALALGTGLCVAIPEQQPQQQQQQQQQPRADSATLQLPPLPSCALPCLLTAMSKSKCSLTDKACVCQDHELQTTAAACIAKACSLADALQTKNATQTACGAPVRDRTGQYYDMSIALGVLAIALVIVRLVFKQFWHPSRCLGPDDKIILFTLLLRVSGTILNIKGLADHGMGRDVWTLPVNQLSTFVMWLYVMEVLYLTELSLIKLSLSAFYLCVFPGTGVRRLLWAILVINVLFGFGFVTAAIFQCTPIHYWWTQYESPGHGHCININALGWSNAVISVVIDMLMIVVPLSQITKLKLHWRKKVGVFIMFLTGTFVTVVSVLRLRSLVSFANSNNPTWDQWEIAYWSTIEVNIGMICTCLPSLRLLLLRLFPKIVGNTTASGGDVSYGHGSRGQSVLHSSATLESHGNELHSVGHAKGGDWHSDAATTDDLRSEEEHSSKQFHGFHWDGKGR